jgi:hypothetical protein
LRLPQYQTSAETNGLSIKRSSEREAPRERKRTRLSSAFGGEAQASTQTQNELGGASAAGPSRAPTASHVASPSEPKQVTDTPILAEITLQSPEVGAEQEAPVLTTTEAVIHHKIGCGCRARKPPAESQPDKEPTFEKRAVIPEGCSVRQLTLVRDPVREAEANLRPEQIAVLDALSSTLPDERVWKGKRQCPWLHKDGSECTKTFTSWRYLVQHIHTDRTHYAWCVACDCGDETCAELYSRPEAKAKHLKEVAARKAATCTCA